MKKTKSKKVRYLFFISLFVVMSFIIVYVGHFLFGDKNDEVTRPSENTLQTAPTPDGTSIVPKISPVKHIQRTETINGLKQEINIMEIDPRAVGIQIQPVLSHDLIYGFEKLSEMTARKKAYAAVNGGFFNEYGMPAGMVVIDGELISASTGRYPVFAVVKGVASLKQIESKLTIEYSRIPGEGSASEDGAGDSGDSNGIDKYSSAGSIQAVSLNSPTEQQGTVVYTPVYGKNNRAKKRSITATVEGGIVTKILLYNREIEIPQKGMLVSFFDMEKYAGVEIPLRVGDAVRLLHLPLMGESLDAYECGSWLVRDGKPVVAERDAWVGIMTNRDPRTAIGIKEDGTVMLLTVDGRQPGYSAGFTGKELAEYLISSGVREAAMLDGGASTEMLVEGKLVSRPSFKGKERPLGGGILVLWK